MSERAVVIVDDNRHIHASLAKFLKRRGFHSQAFASFGEAAAALETIDGPPEAAVIDVFLDGGHVGFDLAGRLRSRFGERVPIAMITGYSLADPAVAQRSAEVRATLLEKPLTHASCHRFLAEAALSRLRLNPIVEDAVVALCLRHELLPQETRILGQLAAGSSRAELATALGISHDTVKWQIRRLLSRTATRDTTQLVALLLKAIGEAPAS